MLMEANPLNYNLTRNNQIEINYDNYKLDDALDWFLQNYEQTRDLDSNDITKSIEIVGDVAYFNVTKWLYPIRHTLG